MFMRTIIKGNLQKGKLYAYIFHSASILETVNKYFLLNKIVSNITDVIKYFEIFMWYSNAEVCYQFIIISKVLDPFIL